MRFSIDSEGLCMASLSDLALVARLGHATIWRALRRLQGAHLITLVAQGKRHSKAVFQLLWRSPLSSFPQFTSPLVYLPEKKTYSPKGRTVSLNPSKRALAWAMAQVRRELASYAITTRRKKLILTAIGASVWRSMLRGTLRAGRQLGEAVKGLIQRLREAQAIGNTQRAWCSCAGWMVQSELAEQSERRQRLEESERQIAEIRCQKEEAAKSWTDVFFASWRELLPEASHDN